MPYNSAVTGIIIRRLRLARGMTQDVLSGLANIPRSHLAMIEAGTKNASVDTLWRIADALKIRPSDLIRKIEDEGKEEK